MKCGPFFNEGQLMDADGMEDTGGSSISDNSGDGVV